MRKLLEVCADSLESAIAAAKGGADRIELCANLVIGGTTPSPALLRAVRRETGLPVRALLRPRFGDFLYTENEFALMLEEGEALLEAGADGLVCGCLTPAGDLDLSRMETLSVLCRKYGAGFTLHRAFDLCRDPLGALADCRAVGVDTVLTSGQANSCMEGLPLLKTLFEQTAAPEIMVGAGVDAAAIRAVREAVPGAGCFHMSGKVTLESGMTYRKTGVSMGLPGLSEFEIYRTDSEKIHAAKEALMQP